MGCYKASCTVVAFNVAGAICASWGSFLECNKGGFHRAVAHMTMFGHKVEKTSW